MNRNETGTTREMKLPMIPLRGTVIFPETVVHFDAGREKSVQAMNTALEGDSRLFVVTQLNAMKDEPGIQDVYMVGTIVRIKQVVRMPDGVFRLLVAGESRAVIMGVFDAGSMQYAEVSVVEEKRNERTTEALALMRFAKKQFDKLAQTRKDLSPEIKQAVAGSKMPGELADILATNILNDVHDMQKALECADAMMRLDLIVDFMAQELDVVQLEAKLQKRVHERIERNNREYYLREQMHVIEDE
ncbi:MAG: LON peptidase substrate-binding domain-containing protein, partial [Clostridia bacterium]|nr:LON peptidase substrate-binding domain-containing protein [Clostridia bacterium]